MPVKKGRHPQQSPGGIRKAAVVNPGLRFSFRLFDANDPELCPATFADGYVQALMDRMKSLSTWTVNEFVAGGTKGLRNHPIYWDGTARPDGFSLPEQYEAYTPFQFSVSANERGRVHGLLIDDTFHVIWLDQDHRLYPGA
jgi:hypothetical protein